MNYLSEILGFYAVAQGSDLSPSQYSLWHALMYMNNKRGWKEWFVAPGVDLKALTGVKSSTTLTDCLKALKKLGYIDYKTVNGGRTLYKMKSVSNNDTVTGMVGGTVTGMVGGTDGGNPLNSLNINQNNIMSEAPNGAPDAQPETSQKHSHDSEHYKMAKWLSEDVAATEERKRTRSEKTLQDWAHSFYLLETRDGIPWKNVRIIIAWARKNEFWRKNIKSAPKFREQYDRLREEMLAEQRKGQDNNGGDGTWTKG